LRKSDAGPSHVREETSESQDIPQETAFFDTKEPGGEA